MNDNKPWTWIDYLDTVRKEYYRKQNKKMRTKKLIFHLLKTYIIFQIIFFWCIVFL